MMKKLYSILCILLLLCVAGTAVFLIILPERIPVHYNFSGEADRVGSKFELVLLPAIAAGLGVLFLFMARHARKKGGGTNERIMLLTGIFTVVFFTLLGFFFMGKALKYDPESASLSPNDVGRFVSVGIGALLVVLGNIMPKLTRNSMIGLRTKWSTANDSLWQKNQRFGGITAVIAGFCMIVLSLVVPGKWNVLMFSLVTALWLAACLVRSYLYYREDRGE